MKARLFTILSILVVLSLLIAACGATPEPTAPAATEAPPEAPPIEVAKIVVIGNSVLPYWSNF